MTQMQKLHCTDYRGLRVALKDLNSNQIIVLYGPTASENELPLSNDPVTAAL
jgi:hypothetical protein